jgi:hypothetical protein
MEEEADNELDELQESTIKKKFHSSTRGGIVAVINYVDSSTNKKLQEYCEYLRTVRETLIKEQQHRSFQKNVTASSNLHYYIQKQAQLLNVLTMNKCIVFL